MWILERITSITNLISSLTNSFKCELERKAQNVVECHSIEFTSSKFRQQGKFSTFFFQASFRRNPLLFFFFVHIFQSPRNSVSRIFGILVFSAHKDLRLTFDKLKSPPLWQGNWRLFTTSRIAVVCKILKAQYCNFVTFEVIAKNATINAKKNKTPIRRDYSWIIKL